MKYLTIKERNLLVSLFLLNIYDFLSTKLLIDKFGFKVEANPILHSLLVNSHNVYSILYVKIIPLFLLLYCYYNFDFNRKRYNSCITILCAIFIGICIWNSFLVILYY